ncbi:GMC family oxidoreductase [Halorutilales archaeon Cl-col2-1]
MSEETDRTPSERVDVCVIGSGPAGALIAHELSERGHETAVLEAGKRFDPRDRDERMERSIRPGHDDLSVWEMGGERDAYTSSGDLFYPLNATRVKAVGGSTLHWQGMVMRLHESDFETRTRHGVARDWPLSYDDLKPYYAEAERRLGVSGSGDNPFAPPRDDEYPLPGFEPSYSDSLFEEACDELGIRVHRVPNARNSESYDGEPACVGYGTCDPVCPSGAKYDATRDVRKAEEEGARVIDRSTAVRLEHDRTGDSVESVVYVTPDGERHRQEARVFVVACGGIENPRLLLLSKSEKYPDGLGNSSGAVGRYFMEHLFAGTGGVLDERTRQNHVGFITSESHEFYDRPAKSTEGVPSADVDRSSLTPIKIEFLNYAGPSPVETALSSDDWGDSLLSDLRDSYGNSVGVGGLVGQRPRKKNYVGLDSSKTDHNGNPVPEINWEIDEVTRRSIRRANTVQEAILSKMGAEVTWQVSPENTGPAYHHMGTTRMGTDSDESVVNPRMRTHDLDNLWIAGSSVFVTSGAMNPTLTIAALSLKAADHIDEYL